MSIRPKSCFHYRIISLLEDVNPKPLSKCNQLVSHPSEKQVSKISNCCIAFSLSGADIWYHTMLCFWEAWMGKGRKLWMSEGVRGFCLHISHGEIRKQPDAVHQKWGAENRLPHLFSQKVKRWGMGGMWGIFRPQCYTKQRTNNWDQQNDWWNYSWLFFLKKFSVKCYIQNVLMCLNGLKMMQKIVLKTQLTCLLKFVAEIIHCRTTSRYTKMCFWIKKTYKYAS